MIPQHHTPQQSRCIFSTALLSGIQSPNSLHHTRYSQVSYMLHNIGELSVFFEYSMQAELAVAMAHGIKDIRDKLFQTGYLGHTSSWVSVLHMLLQS